jgi:threonine dehydrogenase-like Zn-dependent dehydrogenase
MEALVWLGPREMVVSDVPIPEPADGEMLIEVGAAGICGSELSGYLGQNSLRRPPLIMGHEAAGTVVRAAGGAFADGSVAQVGARITFNPLVTCGACDRCQAGRTNLCRKRQLVGVHRPGAFARFVAVPSAQCWPLPDSLSLVAGALAEPLACAVRAVRLAEARAQSSLLILGAGPIGLCCLAVARAAGIESVLVSDVAAPRLEVARRWGAQQVVDARADDLLAAVEALQPGGVEIAIDAVGAQVTRDQALRAVVPGGRVVFIGLHDEESALAANYLVRQEVTIAGSFSYTDDDFARALDLLVAGVIKPGADWVAERPLREGPAAFAELVDGTAKATKIVLRGDEIEDNRG